MKELSKYPSGWELLHYLLEPGEVVEAVRFERTYAYESIPDKYADVPLTFDQARPILEAGMLDTGAVVWTTRRVITVCEAEIAATQVVIVPRNPEPCEDSRFEAVRAREKAMQDAELK